MSGRGRGLRIHKLEPPKPRKSSANTLEALQQQVNGLLIKIKQGSILPNEAKTFNEAVKNISLTSMDQSINEYLSNVVQLLRGCLMTVVFSPVIRMYLLEIIELSASNWNRNYIGCHYYNQKAEDTTFTCKPAGKLKLHHSFSHPGRETNVMRKPFSNHTKTNDNLLSQASPIQRLSKEISTDNNDLLSFKLAVRTKFFLLAKGHRGINIVRLEKQTGTRIVYDEDTGNCIVTIMGTNESDIWRAVSMLEHLVVYGSLPEEAVELNQTKSRSLELFSESSLSDSKSPPSPSELTEDSGFEDTMQVYVYPQPTGQLQRNGSCSITPEARRRSSDVPFIYDRDRRNSGSHVQATDDLSVKAEGRSNKKECALYIKGHILKLDCDNKQILQEAVTVLTAHFDNTSDRNNSLNILTTVNGSSQLEIVSTPKHESSPLSFELSEVTNGDIIALNSAGQSSSLLNSQGWIKSDELTKHISQVLDSSVENEEAEKKIGSTQKVIQYGRHFLLTCSMSPLAREVPEDWQNRKGLPKICLFKPPNYFDPSKYTLPVLLPIHCNSLEGV